MECGEHDENREDGPSECKHEAVHHAIIACLDAEVKVQVFQSNHPSLTLTDLPVQQYHTYTHGLTPGQSKQLASGSGPTLFALQEKY